jgi:hypothetical protein
MAQVTVARCIFRGFGVSFGTRSAKTSPGKAKIMTSRLTVFVLLALLAAAPRPVASAPIEAGQQEKAPKKDAKPADTSLTGCVDEQSGRYILTDDKELTPLANLEADGFPQEGFAKHLGHKVTVRGTSSPGDPRPTFKVRSITTVSETCAPQWQ